MDFAPDEAGANGDGKKPRKCRYRKGTEAQAIKEEIGNFQFETSRGYFLITRLFTDKILVSELRNLLEAARIVLRRRRQIDLPPLSRNAKRSKPLLVKYVDTYVNELTPMLSEMVLENSDHEPIYPRPPIPL
jgi:hypothetical protein